MDIGELLSYKVRIRIRVCSDLYNLNIYSDDKLYVLFYLTSHFCDFRFMKIFFSSLISRFAFPFVKSNDMIIEQW